MQSEVSKFYHIETWDDNKYLRTPSEKITKITPDLVDLADDMFALMYENDWVWLAAPQIGKDIRFIVVTSWKDTKKWPELASETAMINPEIIERSQEMIVWKEACLSVPGIEWNVKRHKNITVEFTTLKWDRRTKKLKDYNAVIVQHEIDHLDGILFTDKLIWK